MAQFEQWFNQDFTHKIEIRHCESIMFTGDDKGAVVGVRLFNDGAAYSAGGTVTGAVKRIDGGLVALTGTLSGNAASVVIPAAALAYPGPIGVHIVLIQGGSTTTVLKAIYTVDDNSGTAVDPGTIIPSINDLITAINNAVASIPSDYSALLHTLAPDFSASKAYSAGDYAWYNGVLYCFILNHTAGAWTGSDAVAAVVGNDLSAVKSALKAATGVGMIQFSDPALRQYIVTNGTTVQWDTPSTSSYTNIKWAVVECSPGDVFTINGSGGNSDRLWAFANSSKTIISVSAASATAEGLVLTAPENAAYLIINDETNSQSYIGDAGRIEKLVNDASDLLKKEYPAWNVSFELGGINSSGDNFDSGVYCRTEGYVPEDVKWIRIKSPYRLLVYMYNKSTNAFIARTLYPQFDYYLRHDLYKFRFSVDNNGELLETTDINEYVDLLPYTSENHVIIQGRQLDIYMGRAHYTFKRMENTSIALYTFRLYSGYFIDETGADVGCMWANSDAEGVIKLVGESDFLGGYHGDENMTSFLITIDGKKFEDVNSYWSGFFADITCVIQSTLYHAGTENPAFTKIKKLSFSEKTVTIRNTLTAVDSGMVVDRGSLAMFQCDNNDLSGVKMLTYVESNNNPGLYESPNSLPPGGSAMTENKYHTTHGMAHIRVTIGPENPNYSAWFQNYSSQDRVKSYFESYDGQTLTANQVLVGEFSITIV